MARGIEAQVASASGAEARERKRAKMNRVDAAMLMPRIPGLVARRARPPGRRQPDEEVDGRRPAPRARVHERSRITNRMKSALTRPGVRDSSDMCAGRAERLAHLRTAEGTLRRANISEELRRDMALALRGEQINAIAKIPAARLARAPDGAPQAMVRLSARVTGISIAPAAMPGTGDAVTEASRSKRGGSPGRAHGMA